MNSNVRRTVIAAAFALTGIAGWTLQAAPAQAARADCCKQPEIVQPDFDPDLLGGFEPSAAERRAEERGKVTVRIQDTTKATMKVVQSETIVRAPVEAVWKVILDYDFYPRLFERMELSETTLKKGDWEHHYTVVQYPWPWGKRWVLNTIHHDPGRWVTRFMRLEGSIKEVEGRWELRPYGKGATLLRYGVRMDPGLELIPKWVVPWATSIVVPDILKSVGKEAEIRWAKTPGKREGAGAGAAGGGGKEPLRPTSN